MSALGQKQTFAPQKGASVLPLKADVKRPATRGTSRAKEEKHEQSILASGVDFLKLDQGAAMRVDVRTRLRFAFPHAYTRGREKFGFRTCCRVLDVARAGLSA